MARDKHQQGPNGEGVISIIGPGMTVVGDLTTDGPLRIEGRVEGSVRVGHTLVIGRDGVVIGDVQAEDAVVSGTIDGSLAAGSRLEVHATARVEGDLKARSMQLDEGAVLNGTLAMGIDHRGRTRASGRGVGPKAVADDSPPTAQAAAS